ncbi:MAG: DUF5131 family protein [Clostridiales bacterium]|nr:DUF5131 family protein [Clostridiales bacterium]
MHDIWNPWHGCVKCSEGCEHCYMYYMDGLRYRDGSRIYRTGGFSYPLEKERTGAYKVKSGELLRVCMTSDFFLEEADPWRGEAWEIIRRRPDVKFFLLTKRPQRVTQCLPSDWGEGWENVFFNVTCENQSRADERIPILRELPFRHKGVMCAPFIGPVSLLRWLGEGFIEQVACGGENYGGKRPCCFEWVKALYEECRIADVTFAFIETGTRFIKEGRVYHLPGKRLQTVMAHKSGLQYKGKEISFRLTDSLGVPLREEELYQPRYDGPCRQCGSKLICNGCARCGKCLQVGAKG